MQKPPVTDEVTLRQVLKDIVGEELTELFKEEGIKLLIDLGVKDAEDLCVLVAAIDLSAHGLPLLHWGILRGHFFGSRSTGFRLKRRFIEGVADVTPSEAGQLHVAENRRKMLKILPQVGQSVDQMNDTAALYACRPCDAPASVFQHLTLLAPEFAFVRDACDGALQGQPPSHHLAAWVDLQQRASEVYAEGHQRQHAMFDWFRKWFSGIPLHTTASYGGSSSSSSSSSSCCGDSDLDSTRDNSSTKDTTQQVTVEWLQQASDEVAASRKYAAMFAVCKAELGSSGDPMFELCRHLQGFYGSEAERWHEEDKLIITTGTPAIGLDFVGPSMMIYGMCILRTNVVGCEPLTDRLQLLDSRNRWPQHAHRGATILAAFDVAVHKLLQRYRRAVPAGWQVADQGDPDKHSRRVREVLQNLKHPGVYYPAAFNSVLLDCKQMEQVELSRLYSECPTPYPLWGSNTSGTRYERVWMMSHDGMPDKATYSARHPDDRDVFIKFTSRDYPDWIHTALAKADVAPQLVECRVLPGGGCMVAMDKLGKGWHNAAVWYQRMKACGCNTVTVLGPKLVKLLRKTHELYVAAPVQDLVRSGDSSCWLAHRRQTRVGGRIALGDCRLANCMVHVEPDPASPAKHKVTDVKFVDLDWAGIVGVARYPAVSIGPGTAIMWHKDVQPGALLAQEHDKHLLENDGW